LLPEVVSLTEILQAFHQSESSDNNEEVDSRVPLGLDVKTLEPFSISLLDGPNFLITGPMQCGKTTLLRTLLRSLERIFSAEQLCIYIFDSRKMELSQFAHSSHVRAYVSDPQNVRPILDDLGKTLAEREEQLLQSRKAGSAADHVSDGDVVKPALMIIVDDFFDPFNDSISENDKELLGNMIRKGRNLGLHLIIAGAAADISQKGWVEPIKSLKEAQVGFLLGSSSSDGILNLRLQYNERDKILPPGEGYWCKHGITQRVKIAVPDKRHKKEIS